MFFFNVPLGIFGTFWAANRLREPKWEVKERKFDWIGTVTFLIGLSGVLMAFTYMSFGDPDMMFTVYIMSAIGLVGLAAFIFIQLRVAHPMMDLRLFKNRNYAVGNLTNLMNGLCIGAAMFLLIFYFQGPGGRDALTAGLLLIPSGLPMMIIGPISGKWSDMYGPKMLTAAGLALTTIALIGLAFIDVNTPLWQLVVLMIILGSGGGLFMSPNASSVMTSVPTERRGIASGARIMLRNTGTMFSLAIAFPLVLTGLNPDDMYHIFLGEGVESVGAEAILSLVNGLQDAFAIFAVISAASIPIALMMTNKK